MEISRELALEELGAIRKVIDRWVGELENPQVIVDGKITNVYPRGIPPELCVSEVEGIPLNQMKAELLMCSGRLEVLAGS